MKNEKLNILREKIDDLDNRILNLIEERSNIVNQIGRLKDKSKSIVDPNREKIIINRLKKSFKGFYSKDTIVRIWRELFYASSKIQMNLNETISSKRGIENVKIYKGGKSSIEGISRFTKLSSNENSFGPSDKVLEILKKEDSINRYPEISGHSLRIKLSKIHNIDPEQIILGNGSDEILFMSALAFCHPGDEIIHSQYCFEMYPIITKLVGAVSVIADEENFKVKINSIINNISDSTKVIFLANPNNPTGTFLTINEIQKLLESIPKNIIVVIDTAYAEYVNDEKYDNSFNLLKQHENVIITRTFSKAYGLAGIRLGWCYTSKKVALILNKIKPPFNVNSLALKISNVALEDIDYLDHVINKNKKNKIWFEEELNKLNIKFLPSFANFTLIECKHNSNESDEIYNLLIKNGIIIRQLHSYNLPNFLRITIGTKSEMKKIVNILSHKKIGK
tara:strand:+ start:3291 stop:4643 length:1353 start_codon:yes stop_codon:yes gene_type:complete